MRAVCARLFTWGGALLFLLSLAYFVIAYLTNFGVPAPDGDWTAAATWNVALFTAFALHHSVFARGPVRQWIARLASPELERPAYVWLASLLFILVCAAWAPVPGMAWDVPGPWRWALRLVQAAGLWLTIRSAAILDVWELAGLRPLRPEALGPGPAAFTTRGPYGWVRHPIYTGWFLFVFAASPMTMTRLVFAVVSGVYLLVAIPFEERTMRATSGGAYDRYAAKVPSRLVPRVY